MSPLVIDASIAIKWVIEEEGTRDAMSLRKSFRLIAPQLLVAECANILWKKVQRKELSKQEARFAARLLQGAEIELLSMDSYLEAATRIAIDLSHPAYECLYLALAVGKDCRFVTADERFLCALGEKGGDRIRKRAFSLNEFTDERERPVSREKRKKSGSDEKR